MQISLKCPRDHITRFGRTLHVVSALLIAAWASATDRVEAGGDSTPRDVGPTIAMSYSRESHVSNPISSFMYFVPLISKTLVDRETSARNVQEVTVVSYDREIRAKSFIVICEFEIRGDGFHRNTFDPSGLIAARVGMLKKNETLTNVMDHVNFEGEGLGRITVKGTIDGATQTVTEVDISFKAGEQKSPVTIGLYDVVPVEGEYKYENRSNQIVARVNALVFKKNDENPTMEVTVASVRKSRGAEGWIARMKGVFANYLLTAPPIEKLGNDTMLRLGYAILNKEPKFTFPAARNLKEDKLVDSESMSTCSLRSEI